MVIGAVLMILSLYELLWLLYDTVAGTGGTFSQNLAQQFKQNPQSFLVGGITFIIAIQFLSLGFLSLQSKRYFEELFHLGTTTLKKQVETKEKG
jgi:hypothetical protein